jgi:hypothetical protein
MLATVLRQALDSSQQHSLVHNLLLALLLIKVPVDDKL